MPYDSKHKDGPISAAMKKTYGKKKMGRYPAASKKKGTHKSKKGY